jgi:hypothetical protein
MVLIHFKSLLQIQMIFMILILYLFLDMHILQFSINNIHYSYTLKKDANFKFQILLM